MWIPAVESPWAKAALSLRDTVRDLLAKGQKKILLNLGDVNYIDSSGIGELVSAFTTVPQPGRRTQAAQPDQESSRPAADHQAVHRLRRERRRSSRREILRQVSNVRRSGPACRSARSALPITSGLSAGHSLARSSPVTMTECVFFFSCSSRCRRALSAFLFARPQSTSAKLNA